MSEASITTALPRMNAAEQALLDTERRMIGSLRDFLGGEVRDTRDEIVRSTQLLRDAIEKLNASFRDMEAQTRQQGATITGLVERGTVGAVGIGSPSVRRFAEEAGQLIGALARVVDESSRESVRTVQTMDETAHHLDEIFALVSENPSSFSQRVRELVQSSKLAVARVRSRVEDTADREMSASVDAKLKADGLIAQVHAINRSLAEGMHVVANCTDHIRESVATAVRSLQFEDIATQSLAAASIHLDRLEAMNQQATPLQDSLDQASAAADARLHSLEQFGRYVQQLREGAIRPVRKAVSQTDMRSGAVDLF